jgi:hypothetical protein
VSRKNLLVTVKVDPSPFEHPVQSPSTEVGKQDTTQHYQEHHELVQLLASGDQVTQTVDY